MEPPGSTLVGHPGGGRGGVGGPAPQLLCASRGPLPPEKLTALLLPMVRRAVRTECGPAALVCWLRRRTGAPPGAEPTERAARALTEDLVRALFAQPDFPDETLDDSR